MKVFLGGTCNKTTWRDEIIPMLREKNIDYFNPVVDDWNTEAQLREYKEKQESDFYLYVITPKATGVFSIAEVVDDSNKKPDKTLFTVLKEDHGLQFSEGQYQSLMAVKYMVDQNGGYSFDNLYEIVNFLIKRK